jgi:uncharacterized protein (DUF169 family)
MASIKTYQRYGKELEELLRLRTSPIAVKMLASEEEVPEGAIRPSKEGQHYAQCQVFALSRRDRQTVAMFAEDHWCPGPAMAYGQVPFPERPGAAQVNLYERFPYGKYPGILSAPLDATTFEPDVVLIYADTDQLRQMLLSLKDEERPDVKTNVFPFSCAYGVTNAIINNEYWVNLPDPGERVRALALPGEMILSVPRRKLPGFMAGLKAYFKESRYAHEQMMMMPDFPQPEFYKQAFKNWELPQGS